MNVREPRKNLFLRSWNKKWKMFGITQRNNCLPWCLYSQIWRDSNTKESKRTGTKRTRNTQSQLLALDQIDGSGGQVTVRKAVTPDVHDGELDEPTNLDDLGREGTGHDREVLDQTVRPLGHDLEEELEPHVRGHRVQLELQHLRTKNPMFN
jgi:hypothetical protein